MTAEDEAFLDAKFKEIKATLDTRPLLDHLRSLGVSEAEINAVANTRNEFGTMLHRAAASILPEQSDRTVFTSLAMVAIAGFNLEHIAIPALKALEQQRAPKRGESCR